MAISFTFLDNEKTLTDKEIDGMMNRIMKTAEEELKLKSGNRTINSSKNLFHDPTGNSIEKSA